MAKKNLKKQKLIKNTPNSSITTPSKTITKNHQKPKPNNPIRPDSDSESDSEPIPIKLQKLLEPYSKDQLVSLAVDTALSNPSFYTLIQSTADKDITHRKIFVYGLARDTTRQTLVAVFEQFGEVEECNVVMDHVTGKAKGYAFVVFKARKSAVKALREPQKRIGNRLVSCKLASLKESGGECGKGSNELGSRKIYVSNVAKDVDSEELRVFFEKFGEIEAGPMGFDQSTGKSKGYALFVYKTVEEAKKCLEEPCKMFKGRQLHCKKANEGKSGGGVASITSEVVQAPQFMAMPPYGAVVADQNMAMMNPFYGGILPYGAYVNPFVGVGGFGQQMGIAGYGGGLLDSLGGGGSVLGSYGSVSGASSSGGVAPGLLQAYPNKQVGQPSPAKFSGNSGYSSHSWYFVFHWILLLVLCFVLSCFLVDSVLTLEIFAYHRIEAFTIIPANS